MAFEDKTLSCGDCHQAFNFSAGEQDFFAAKNLVNVPKRCPNCRMALRLQREGKDPQHGAEVPCDQCGTMAHVPFKPTGAKPVYCFSCMHQKKQLESAEK